MEKKLFIYIITLTVFLLHAGTTCYAQKAPLKGSGKIVNKKFDYKDFDKLEILDLDGTVNVEVGKPFAVNIDIDDNLAALLDIKQNDGELRISLEGNAYNRLYVEESNIKITITMPEVSVVKHRSNSNMNINGITGRYFRIKSTGNGKVTINGSIDELDIICNGNGTVRAEGMIAKEVKVNKSGNGNVYIKTENNFAANGSGNGDVVNYGKGKATGNSAVTGNGEIKYAYEKSIPLKDTTASEIVHTLIKNETAVVVHLSVKYPVKGSYGISVKPNETVKEKFPVGTKIFRGNQFTTLKKPVYTVTAAEEQQYIIKP